MMNTDLEALLRDAGRTPPASGVDVTRAVDRARTVRKRRRLGLVGGAAGVVLAAGATFAVVGLPQVDRSPAAGADPVLTRLGPGGMDALLHGVVRRSGDCLLLDPGGDATVVVWPRGTRWSAGDEAVVLPDGLRVGLGDEVEGGGGYLPADRGLLNRAMGEEPADRAIGCAHSVGQRSVAMIGDVRKV